MSQQRVVLITGSGGLVGSGLARSLLDRGHVSVFGVDNNSRARFFGKDGSTAEQATRLYEDYKGRYCNLRVDIRERRHLFSALDSIRPRPDAIVHCAAQPSHDWAAANPSIDFQINATGTLNVLDWARENARDAIFVYMSSNKVYSSDDINSLKLKDHGSRFDVLPNSGYWQGVNERMPVGRGSRSLYGTSKLAGDLLTQEFGLYYGLRTVVLRCSSMTGPHHSAVELHGFLAYIARQVATGNPYFINGYEGKQVRDNLHYDDAVRAINLILDRPPDKVSIFNLGGGRGNSCSIKEAIKLASEITGEQPTVHYRPTPRRADFRWWITDNSAFMAHYPEWRPLVNLTQIMRECLNKHRLDLKLTTVV
jgi:CDP-paratose 2-epimerase